MVEIIGHTEVYKKLLSYANNGKLAGSWIFSGVKGVGKRYVADMLANALTGENTANVKTIERGLTDKEKKELIKLIADGKELNHDKEAERERKAEITVDDVRELDGFTAFKSLDNTPKIIIIDSVDEMNVNAANALLKTLEEPPSNTIMILISHQMQKLLPTIKSRCRVVKFMPINDNMLREHLKDTFIGIKDIELVIKLSEGSVGRAYEIIQNDGTVIYNDIIDGFVMGKTPAGIGKGNIDFVFELVFAALSRLIKHIEGVNDTLPIEVMAFDHLRLSSYKTMKFLNQTIDKYNKSKLLYLDKNTILDSLFFNLKRLK